MNSFLKKIGIYACLVLILLSTTFLITKNAFYKQCLIYSKKNTLHTISKSLDGYTLVLGSSHAFYGIQSGLLSPTCINMALASQSFIEDFAILKYAYHENPLLKNVFMTYSYHSNIQFLYQSKRNEEIIRAFQYQYVYNINYPFELYSVKNITKFLSNWASFIKKMGSKNTYQLDKLGNSIQPYTVKTNAIHGCQERVEMHFENGLNCHNRTHPYFDSIVHFCKKNNIALDVIIPPYTQCYTDNLKKQVPEAFKFINNLSLSKQSGFVVHDYRDMFKHNEDVNFKDTDHLSPYGSKILTKSLQQECSPIH